MNKVEGRWRNLVTLYKTSVDRNILPNVEPRRVAFHSDLEALVRYVPQRRHNYEKKKGRSVVMGESATVLICCTPMFQQCLLLPSV